MYDKQLIARRFADSLRQYNDLAEVQSEIAEQLALSLEKLQIRPSKITEIGSGTGFLTRRLVSLYPNSKISAIDIVKQCQEYLPASIDFITGDAENIDFQQYNDLIASSSAIQWFEDLPQFISRAIDATKSKGIIAISTFGPENFKEIAATTGQTLKYYSLQELCSLFGDAEILESREWSQTLEFSTPIDVLRHIKATGVNAITPTKWTKEKLNKFTQDYIEMFKLATLTFHPQIIIARKR